MTLKVNLLTYGAQGRYLKAAHRLAREARQSGAFDSIWLFDQKELFSLQGPETALDLDFIKRSQAGNGFWLWKPLLIDFVLQDMKSDEILVYLDAGCELNFRNPTTYRNFDACVSLANTQGVAVAFGLGKDCEYTKRETLEAFDYVKSSFSSRQVDASVLFFSSSEKGKSFVRTWLDWCRTDSYFHLTMPEPRAQMPIYVHHNSEQSIFSILYHKASFTPLPVPVTFPDESDDAPGWAKEAKDESKLMKRFGRLDMSQSPFKFASHWRRRGRDFPIWASRNRRSLPLYAPTFLGYLSRAMRLTPILMLREATYLARRFGRLPYDSSQ